MMVTIYASDIMLYAKRVRMGKRQPNISLIADKLFHPFTGFTAISICGYMIASYMVFSHNVHEKYNTKTHVASSINVHMPENGNTCTCILSKATKIRNCNFWK